MWADVINTPQARIVVVRECVAAELLGCETPESYDSLERAAVMQGEGSFDSTKLEVVGKQVSAILWTLRQAGVPIAKPTHADAGPD
jgi:hypothetical protein